MKLPVREQIGRFKYTQEADIDAEYARVDAALSAQMANAVKKEGR